MADIFLSYAEEDRDTARKIAGLLESGGWSVWWDRKIPAGKTWHAVVEEALGSMRCMVVLWSGSSIRSEWVREEAEEGRARGKLVPILIERVVPPLGLRAIQAADLADWDGSIDAPGARQLIGDLEAMLGRPIPALAGQSAESAQVTGADLDVPLELVISALRRRLLVASERDFQELLYEIEAILSHQPNDVSARLLKDEIMRAMAPPGSATAPSVHGSALRAWSWSVRPVIVGLCMVLVVPFLFVLLSGRDHIEEPVPAAAPPDKSAPVAEQGSSAKTRATDPSKPNNAIVATPKPGQSYSNDVSKKKRCEEIVARQRLGESLSAEDGAFLQKECRR